VPERGPCHRRRCETTTKHGQRNYMCVGDARPCASFFSPSKIHGPLLPPIPHSFSLRRVSVSLGLAPGSLFSFTHLLPPPTWPFVPSMARRVSAEELLLQASTSSRIHEQVRDIYLYFSSLHVFAAGKDASDSMSGEDGRISIGLIRHPQFGIAEVEPSSSSPTWQRYSFPMK
jgi:hypothetical protein